MDGAAWIGLVVAFVVVVIWFLIDVVGRAASWLADVDAAILDAIAVDSGPLANLARDCNTRSTRG